MKRLFVIILIILVLLCCVPFSAFAASSALGYEKEVVGGWEFINTSGVGNSNWSFSNGANAEPLYIACNYKPVGAQRARHNMYDLGVREADDLVYQVGGIFTQYCTNGWKIGQSVCRVYISCASGVLDDQNVSEQVAPWGFSISYIFDSSTLIQVRPFQSYSPIYDNRVVNLTGGDLGLSFGEAWDTVQFKDLNWYIIADSVNQTQELFFIIDSRVIPVMKLHATDTVYQDFTVGCYDRVYPINEANGSNMWEMGAFYYSNITYGYQAGYAAGLTASYDNGYHDGYQIGLTDGELFGYEDGQREGYDSGYNKGYGDGIKQSGVAVDVPGVVDSVMQATPTLFNRIFDFNIFGINVAGLLAGVIVLTILIWVIKKVKT